MNQIEWKIYTEWADFLIKKHCRPPIGFIYLKADPEVCFARVQKRNRASENSLTLDYIKQIDDWHNLFLIEKKDVIPAIKAVPTLILDCNEDFVKGSNILAGHIEKIKKFLRQTQNPVERAKLITASDQPYLQV